MAIPGFQDIMLPLMHILQDQQEHVHSNVIEALAKHFHLTENERRVMLRSGKQSQFDNRVGWSKTHLSKAGVIETTGRGRYRITQRGLDLLATQPSAINMQLLMKYPEFREFRTRNDSQPAEIHDGLATPIDDAISTPELTPDEMLQSAYHTLRQTLERDLLERVKQCSPEFFERLVIDVLVAMGYGGTRADAATRLGRSGDEGIDGTIKEDRLGLDVIYIQAKRWEKPVGRPEVQGFVGALVGQQAQKGVFITTSKFSQLARDYVEKITQKIILIDGEELAAFMVDYDVGVTPAETFVIKKPDLDYFENG
ncbi:MAG: restriction endonuclease [Chloroflexaceae bacterium]|nr:restriction endonuclease [Chloroflexaceae bacterium]